MLASIRRKGGTQSDNESKGAENNKVRKGEEKGTCSQRQKGSEERTDGDNRAHIDVEREQQREQQREERREGGRVSFD
jgi:hypothetical protein